MNKVWLSRAVYTRLLEEAIRKMPLETGGILLGYWGTESEAVITSLTGPGPKAIHKQHYFMPDSKYHEAEINRHYKDSERQETYLGDWHTHPYGRAYLSDRDRLTIKKIANYAPARLRKPLMIILGTKPFELVAWTHTYENTTWGHKSTIQTCSIELF